MVILKIGDFMKNKYWIIIVLVLITIGIGIYFLFNNLNKNNNRSSEYVANKTETSITESTNENSFVNEDTTKNQENEKNKEPKKEETPPIETELSSFSTKIYSKDPARQNNVQITCSSLNYTIVENGATFSFCNTVGQATTTKGYQKAEIFDAKRK